jgi:polysaccharide export outer membrane protein
MKQRRLIVCVFFLLVLSLAYGWAAGEAPAQAAAGKTADEIKGNDTDYIIGPGDQLDISVWKDEAMTKVVAVLPDGKIHFPLIGEVIAAGKTVAQLKHEMEVRILPYVPEVVLSVDIRQVNSMLIYVIGRVNNPGRLVLNAQVNVLQALATAGGLNPFAKRCKIKIFRQEAQDTKIFKFDYDDVSNGKHLEQNIFLERGDVIVVP